MAVIFYPLDELDASTLQEKLEHLLTAAENFKAAVLEISPTDNIDPSKRLVPRELKHAFNWQELAKLLRELRELPEGNNPSKAAKAEFLKKLAEIYEVLKGAKMSKLEAVRLALMNEANQLRASAGVG